MKLIKIHELLFVLLITVFFAGIITLTQSQQVKITGNKNILIDSTYDDNEHKIHHSSDSTDIHRKSSDDGPMHDIYDDHGQHQSSDSTEIHHRGKDDGPMHDINDDKGKHHDNNDSHHHKQKGKDK